MAVTRETVCTMCVTGAELRKLLGVPEGKRMVAATTDGTVEIDDDDTVTAEWTEEPAQPAEPKPLTAADFVVGEEVEVFYLYPSATGRVWVSALVSCVEKGTVVTSHTLGAVDLGLRADPRHTDESLNVPLIRKKVAR